jgi:uncharacterized protein (DUF58 family)
MDLGLPAREGELKLKATRTLRDPKALVEERVLVELKLSNQGAPMKRITLEDVVPRGVTITRGSSLMTCSLEGGESATLRYEVTVREPREAVFTDCRVSVQSRFALGERRVRLSAPGTLRVYPRLVTRRVETGRSMSFSWTGSSPSRYRGGRVEFVDIRNYVVGDPIRDVNWRASARLGRRVVNEWKSERGQDCIIVVDFSAASLAKVGEWSARSDVVSCAYELGSSLLSASNRVGMLVLGDVASKVRPGFGSRQLRAMLDHMVTTGEGTVWRFEDVDYFLETFFRRQYGTRGGTLFLVSAWPSVSLLESERILSGKGFNCNSVLVDTLGAQQSALLAERSLKRDEALLGRRVATAELRWFEDRFREFSKVYEWNREIGFTELGEARGR